LTPIDQDDVCSHPPPSAYLSGGKLAREALGRHDADAVLGYAWSWLQAHHDAAGKYAAWIAKAEKTFVSVGDQAKYDTALAKCLDKYGTSWDKLEASAAAASTVCPSVGDKSPIQLFLDTCGQSVAEALSGGVPLGPDPVTCASDLATCEARPPVQPLKTGQTLCYDASGTPIGCAGSGQDAEFLKGADNSFTDNLDGTITDNSTGLMWEKQSDDGTIHDKDNAGRDRTARNARQDARL